MEQVRTAFGTAVAHNKGRPQPGTVNQSKLPRQVQLNRTSVGLFNVRPDMRTERYVRHS